MSHDPMEEIRASFFLECEELMESLQDALVVLEGGGSDNETINVIFRAVHSIKGGAGAFGLNALVSFAHRFETVMDELRAGRLELTDDAVKLFFQGADVLQDHVRAAQLGGPEPDASEAVLESLEALLGEDGLVEDEAVDFAPLGLAFSFTDTESDLGTELADESHHSFESNDDTGELPVWHISFKPHAKLYSCGNEALHILNAIGELGDHHVQCKLPSRLQLDEATAEIPEISWEITLTADCELRDINEVFDFVADVCDLQITPMERTFHRPFAEAVGAPDPPGPVLEADPSVPQMKAEPFMQIEPAEPAPKPSAASDDARSAAPEAASRNQPPAPSEPATSTVRVDLDRIDRLVNLVGELVINQAMLAQSVSEAGIAEQPAVVNGLEEFMMLTRDIQDSVMMIRAQPVKPLFQRMSRIVREASSAVGKKVRLKTEGETTEVDKTVIERLADPLTHMIRNAVDHGIEAQERRLSSGKPAEGIITLSASHRAGRVLIEISDDGAGINRTRVREIAVTKGLISADAQLTDNEIDNLLFLPGFSTATEISNLSGRGVGMDVVKSAISALGGRVTITSNPGQGTTFSISLPLTLAVLDGMVVRVANQTLVVPLNAIVETATLTPHNIKAVGAKGELLHIRGDFVALHDLGVQLGFRKKENRKENSIVLLTSQDDGSRTALIVDSIMEQRQVVIKGLGKNYGHIPGVAAATILGDGQIALILDPADLARCDLIEGNDNLIAVAG